MNMTLNRLPSITWYWLKMNNGSLEGVDPAGEVSVKEEIPSQITAETLRLEDLPEQATGMGKDMTALVRTSGVPVHSYATAVWAMPFSMKRAASTRSAFGLQSIPA